MTVTRTTAVFFIKYLRTLGFDVTNDIFARNAWYFRNALVRANYNNYISGVCATTEYLKLFLRNLLLGEKNELRNRSLHISGILRKQDIGSPKQDIQGTKQDIEIPNSVRPKTKAHIEALFMTFGFDTGIWERGCDEAAQPDSVSGFSPLETDAANESHCP